MATVELRVNGRLEIGQHVELLHELFASHETVGKKSPETLLQMRYVDPEGFGRGGGSMASGEGQEEGLWRQEKGWSKRVDLRLHDFQHRPTQYNMQVGLGMPHPVNLNDQMEVWVQLYGGGPNQPCRMVVYADVCMLNQSTLLLEYVNLERYPVLRPDETTPKLSSGREALSLLRTRPNPTDQMPPLRLHVAGVSSELTRNQKVTTPDGEPAHGIAAPGGGSARGASRGGRAAGRASRGVDQAVFRGRVLDGHTDGDGDLPRRVRARRLRQLGRARPPSAEPGAGPRADDGGGGDQAALPAHQPPRRARPVPRGAGAAAAGARVGASLSDIFRPHESGSDIFRPHEEQSRALVTHGFFSRADDFEMHHEGGGNPFSLEWADEPRDHRSAFALPDEEQLANLPSAPPNSVVPMYAFPPVTHTRASLHGLLRLLFLRTAVGGGDGGVEEWSPPLQLVDETRAHLFARMRSAGREGVDADLRILRVSFNQEGPTTFVTLEDATETPPCCIRNDSNRTVYYSISIGDGKEQEIKWTDWHELPPSKVFSADSHAGTPKLEKVYEEVGVPLLWPPAWGEQSEAGGKRGDGSDGRGRELRVKVCADKEKVAKYQPEDENATRENYIVSFNYGELHKQRALRYAEENPSSRWPKGGALCARVPPRQGGGHSHAEDHRRRHRGRRRGSARRRR